LNSSRVIGVGVRHADDLSKGWNNWYRSHREVEGLRFDLLRLRGGKLEGFPQADALIAQVQNLSSEEVEQLRARLATGG
jgi:hypothetical protein